MKHELSRLTMSGAAARPVCYTAAVLFAGLLAVFASRNAVSAPMQSGALVRLQPDSPGLQQMGNVNISGAAIAGSYSGDGAALMNLDATNITSGVMADARLSASVALRNVTNTFTSTNLFNSGVGMGGAAVGTPLRVRTILGFGIEIEGGAHRGLKATDGVGNVAELANSQYGVLGRGTTAAAVRGIGTTSYGVHGTSNSSYGVFGSSTSGSGIRGESQNDPGVYGVSGFDVGVYGSSSANPGVHGQSTSNAGVYGNSNSSVGVQGISGSGDGLSGASTSSLGVRGTSGSNWGVYGQSTTSVGVAGFTNSGSIAVFGNSANGGYGMYGQSDSGYGIYGVVTAGGIAGYFTGGPLVANNGLFVNGTKQFRIDHPLDPANKYLNHSCVESDEAKNMYDGTARLDERGEAWVLLPDWFDALNENFRYSLTAIGGAMPDLHVATEIESNRFKIAGGKAGGKVSWQVTGTRKDAYMRAHPMQVEEEKVGIERGTYLSPIEHGQPEMMGLDQQIRRRIGHELGRNRGEKR